MLIEDKVVKRRFSNYLLDPLLQTKIGLYCIVLSLAFSLVIMVVLYHNLSRLFQFIMEMTEAPAEVESIIWTYLNGLQQWIVLCLAVYIMATVGVCIWYTHRLVGPMVAFKRHFEALEKGEFTHRTILRKNDAFHEAANALNRVTGVLGDKLGEKMGSKKSHK